MSRKDEMIARMPGYYRNDPLTNDTKNAEAIEFDKLDAQRKDVFLQFNPETATWGISNWEKIFDLPIDENKPLQERRELVLGKMRFNEIVTIAKIKSVASAWLGGEVDVVSNHEQFTYEITFIGKIGVPKNLDDIKNTLRELIPANLGITYHFRYLLIKEIHNVLTLNEMNALTLDKFAGGVN
jgi:hypothetical protein